MSDFSLPLEDINLLINGKIPLIISQPGRLMQPTKSCTILFWRSTGAIRNRLLVHWLRFQADLPFFLSKRLKKKPCFFRGANIYPPRKNACKLNEWQAARLTSSVDFLSTMSLSTSKYLPEKRYIFLRFILFIKAVEKLSSSLCKFLLRIDLNFFSAIVRDITEAEAAEQNFHDTLAKVNQ